MFTKLVALQATLRTFLADRLARNESGASLVEYALLLALIAVVAIGALIFLGHGVNNTLQNVANNLANP
jgi:pilus assembly protein Flp/PilA